MIIRPEIEKMVSLLRRAMHPSNMDDWERLEVLNRISDGVCKKCGGITSTIGQCQGVCKVQDMSALARALNSV